MSAETPADMLRSVEFDSPFTVTPSGEIGPAPAGVYAPECYHSEADDVDLAGAGEIWEPLTGYTGQYGYRGAVMHASEYLGGGLARDILASPGVYVVVVVSVLPDSECLHCGRTIEQDAAGRWVDPEADGDDSVWRETCDAHGTVTAEHEPCPDPEPAGWAVLRLRDGAA